LADPELDLTGRVAVVTGAGRGIGAAYATALASHGAKVVVADIDAEAAASCAKRLSADGHTAVDATVDISDRDSTLALASRVHDEFGAAHIVVNNAAIYHSMRLDRQLDVDIDYWRRVFSVNLDGALLVTQAFAPLLISAGWGRVVMQSSVAAYSGGGGAYGVSKLALLGLTRGFARELGEHGVTVNGIAPGPVLNEATAATVPEDKVSALVSSGALKRAGSEDDLVGALLFLCSDLSAWMTGQTLIVDGGITVRY
jgi:NAD(P)-dependent dehydrogenase (short-subunit alcohol dehydrogenase family)